MTTTEKGTARSRNQLPAAARRRHPRSPEDPSRGVPAVPRRRRLADRSLHLAGVARAGEAAAGSGSSPAARSTSRVGDFTVYDIAGRSYFLIRSDTTPSRPSRTPACTRRQLKQYDGNCWRSAARSTGSPGTRRQPAGRPGAGTSRTSRRRSSTSRGQGRHVGRVRLHQPRSGRRAARGVRRAGRPLRPLEPARPLRAGPRVEGHSGQLEDRPGGVLRGVPRQRHASADPPVHRRHQQPGRRLGELRRVITPAATPSPLIDWAPDDETILRYALDVRLDEELFLTVKEGETARSAMADATATSGADRRRADRRVVRRRDGRQPRLHAVPQHPPVGAFNRIVYRFRPNGDDHRSSIMEVFFLARSRASGHHRRRSTSLGSTSRGPMPWSWGYSARCSSRTRSTWLVQLGLETRRSRVSRWPTTRRARFAGST